MPIRVKSKAQPQRDASPVSTRYDFDLPDIEPEDEFRHVVKKLSLYFTDVVELPSTFEQLRTTSAGESLRTLVDHLSTTCTNPAIVNALLALKWHYMDEREHQGLSEARSYACEIVAWRFLTRMSERQAVDLCLYEIPDHRTQPDATQRESNGRDTEHGELSPLLDGGLPHASNGSGDGRPVGSSAKKSQLLKSLSRLTYNSEDDQDDVESDATDAFIGLNALEIAAIANAKRFLSQHVVQKIITGIWNGDIIFWDSLSVHSAKRPRFYNSHTSDPFSRLRVPKYLKAYEVLFFAIFLCLYYAVLITRTESHITGVEIALFLWIAAFFYDELSEWIDAGSVFYTADVWNLFDMVMIFIGIVFATLRIIGLSRHDKYLNDLSFDVLSLEALFMIPRICSFLSLSPYWGTLIPCLKEMGKDFLKFMVLIIIVYCGFLTTFSLIGRSVFSFGRMTGILTKIFFGSSFIGFEVMEQIDPVFGPPLMIIFITLTSILLTGSLTGVLSNSFSRVTTHAKEEYLYVYGVYVLEASTSNRLTHFYPPFNLLAFAIFRPWRLIFPKDDKFRAGRILLLKVTHVPIVGAIQLYEYIRGKVQAEDAGFKGPQEAKERRNRRPEILRARPSSGYNSHRQGLTSPRSLGMLRPDSAGRREDDLEAPSDAEVHIAELSRKIDQLTQVVLAMQESQTAAQLKAD